HREIEVQIEAIARGAVRASNQTVILLMDLLQNNSTEGFIKNLTEQLAEMQQVKKILTIQVNESLTTQLALEEQSVESHITLTNITSSLRQLAVTIPRQTLDSNQTEDADLVNKTTDLALHVQTKEELISKIREEMEPLMQSATKNLERVDQIHELKAHAQEAMAMALSSVVTAKEVESEVISLHRELEGMQREWPRREAQTKIAVKKERPLGEKVLADVRKKVKQMEKMLKPALENTSLSSTTAKEAEDTAHAVAKESKATLTQAKLTRTASSQLSSHTDVALKQLAMQENLTANAHSKLPSKPEVTLSSVTEDIKAAKLEIEVYSLTLNELITKIDRKVPLEHFNRVLNETARRLSMLRGSVESPALGWKIEKLRSAAKEQENRMFLLEKDLQEIRDERDSLKDISLTLPRSCPQATGTGKG
ncbi:laminin subunit gamma-3-like, partial [Lampris incognitus]|uniref:laminin subunit gamma-3-like n=1 Tax=Lampris incognitus TaxID=2546036 RepID=UPI0024B53D77